MKKPINYLSFVLVIVLVGQIVFGLTCPDPVDCPIPFEHDPNMIVGQQLGGSVIALGETFVYDVNVCDPDETNQGFIFEIVRPPTGATITSSGTLTWKPGITQLAYLVVKVTDVPVTGQPLSVFGTFGVLVIPPNRPPVIIGGCLPSGR